MKILRIEKHKFYFIMIFIVTLIFDNQYTSVGGIDPNKQWNMVNVSIEDAWKITEGNKEVAIAIIDSGVDFNHSDLMNSSWRNIGEIINNGKDDDDNGYIDDGFGWDFRDNDNDPSPGHIHGTFVAGLLAASGNSSGIRGVAPNVKLMSLRFLDDNNLFYDDDWLKLIEAIDYAVDNGAEIINFSLEFLNLPSDPEIALSLNKTIDKAYKEGVVMVSVTGNAGQDSITFPGKFPEVIAVSATDKENKVANFSNYGSENEICAPGVDIHSTIPGGGYQTISGTSYSAPLVSGAIGLMISLKPGLHPFEIREILQQSSIDLGAKGKDPLYGFGLLNISAALVMALKFSSSEKQSNLTLTTRTTPLEFDNMTFFLIIALFFVQNMRKKH